MVFVLKWVLFLMKFDIFYVGSFERFLATGIQVKITFVIHFTISIIEEFNTN